MLLKKKVTIAHAATPVDKDGKILVEKVEVRIEGDPATVAKDKVDLLMLLQTKHFQLQHQ
jgi:hypothetical protein